MLGKLHLICVKTFVFMLKLHVTFHTSVKRKINFKLNSYNYNFFLYSVSLVLFNIFS